jgi:hypothetical protein
VIFGHSEEEPPPEARLGGSATTATTAPAASDPEPSGPHEGLILLLFTILTLAVAGFVLAKEEHHALHDPAAQADRGEIQGLDELSLLRESRFRQILKKIEDSDHPLVEDVRLSAGRADITVQNENGDEKDLTVDPSLDVQEEDSGSSTSDTVPVQAIDAAAPERMVRAVAQKSGRGADAVDYVTMTFLTQRRPDWTIALKEGPAKRRYWLADFHGRDVRQSGEPSAQIKQLQDRTNRQLRETQRRVQQRTKCLSHATDADSAARCLQRFPP